MRIISVSWIVVLLWVDHSAHGWIIKPLVTRIDQRHTNLQHSNVPEILPQKQVNQNIDVRDTESSPFTNFGAIAMSIPELSEYMGGTGKAKLVWDFYKIGIDPAIRFGTDHNMLEQEDFETISRLLPFKRRRLTLGGQALKRLAASYSPLGKRVQNGVASLSHISQSADSTTKMLLRLQDGLEVETVIIPFDGKRSTLCISSQVGCRQGCTFCATGRMGRLRSLSSEEILAQMFYARKICRIHSLPPISNVVFMGMGEPADNVDAVIKATEILTTNECFQLSTSKVTVSTVAPTPDSFRQFANAPCVLAWSVHGASDEMRRQLVPTTKYKMSELRQGLIDTLLQRPLSFRAVMLEVVLIDQVNDGLEQAEELAQFVRVIVDAVPGIKLMINLIPFNDIGHQTYRRPSADNVAAFQKHLWDNGLHAHVRVTRGDDESAACGQLSTLRQQKKLL